jgi:tetratricopeptide (TPR) repeat protein
MRHIRLRRHAAIGALLTGLALSSVASAQDAPPAPAPEAEAAPTAPDTDVAPVPPIPEIWSPVPRDEAGRSAYGLYIAGRLALTRGEGAVGADYLAEAEALTPEQPRVRDQAFTGALLAGDLDVAARLSPPTEETSPSIGEAGKLVAAVQAFAAGDARTADARLQTAPVGAPHSRAGLFVAPWIAAAAGDWDRALAAPPTTSDALTTLFARQNRALLLENRRRYDEAEAELKGLTTYAVSGPLFRLPYGEFLERRGRRAEALALYDAAGAAGQADLGIRRARARAASGGRPPAAPSFRQGAALGLTAAAAQAVVERANEFAVVYLRLALNLEPTPEARLRLGQALARANLDAAARAALAEVGSDPADLYAAARLQLGLSLQADGQSEAALAEFETAARVQPADPLIARVLAGQLMELDRHEQALAILNGPLLNTPEQGFDIRFLRGAAYESLGRVPEAEAELWAALQAQPDNANALNYLGYLWVDSGSRVAEGAEMIARAFAAAPESGNIQDSLGWAQYRQGQYETAVETLEAAVAKEPANAEINDHLGDAYWQVGRRREAGFQWRRVLTLDPEAERRAEVEQKLERGLVQSPAA